MCINPRVADLSIRKIWTFFQKSFRSHHGLGEVFPLSMAKSNTLNPSIYSAFGRLMLLSANAVKQWKDLFSLYQTQIKLLTARRGESEN